MKSTVKRWSVYLAVSLLISSFGVFWFISYSAKEGCLNSGGRWLGLTQGCDNGFRYSMAYLASVLAILIYLGIVLGITSVLVQLHTMVFKSFFFKK